MNKPAIVADPHIQWGAPTLAGSRVTVRVIVERFYAGETLAEIARDYEIAIPEVEAALRAGTRYRSDAEIIRRLHE